MKRILHISQTLTGGGAETLVRQLAPRLNKRGLKVGVVTVYGSNLPADDKNNLGYELYELNKQNRFDLLPFFRLLHIIRRFQPDLIHSHTYAGKFWGRGAAAICGVPVILTEHGVAYNVGLIEKLTSGILDKKTAAVAVFSETTARIVSKVSDVKDIRVIPNGVELDLTYDRGWARNALQSKDGELSVLTIGRLYDEKAPDVAIEALHLLPKPILERVRLHWLGDGPLLLKTKAFAAALGIEEHVIFHGFRPDARMLLAGADLALSSSKIEAAPIWLIEAMAAGVPIVATPTLGAADLVGHGHTGLVAPSHEPSALAATLARALADPRWLETASLASKARARKYDIESVADAYVTLYLEVIQKCASRT